MKPMDKPFRFYDDEYDEARLSAMSLRGLRELLKDIEFTAQDLDIWIQSHPAPLGEQMPDLTVKKMGFKAAIMRFRREVEREIAKREAPIAECFLEVCRRDFSAKDFEEIMRDAKAYQTMEESKR